MSEPHDTENPPDPALELQLERAVAPVPEERRTPPPSEAAPHRRDVMARLVAFLAAAPFLGGLVVALRAGLSPIAEEAPARVPLGKLREVPEQGLLRRAVTFPVRRGPRMEPVTEVLYLTRDDGDVIAFSARCTHQGCPVVEAKEVSEAGGEPGPALRCPCHDGAFTSTGEPAGGPVVERLPRLRLDLPDTPDGTIYWVRTDA